MDAKETVDKVSDEVQRTVPSYPVTQRSEQNDWKNQFYKSFVIDQVELLTLLTTQVENEYVVSHLQYETFSKINYYIYYI